MCYSETTSFVAFSISVICFVYLLYYGLKTNNKYDIFAAVVTMLIGFMQLVEYFLWGSQDCSQTNHNVSLLILVLLYTQGIVATGTSMYLFSSIKGNYLSYFIIAVCILYTIFTIYTLKWLNQRRLCSKPTKNSCRLAWAPYTVFFKTFEGFMYFLTFSGFYSILLYYYFLIQFVSFNKSFTKITANYEPFNKYPIRYLFLPVTYFIALAYTLYHEGSNYIDILGSFWCFSAVGFGIVSCLHI
jgi:hypothetical protein